MKSREDLIHRVLKNLGVLAAGQAPTDEDRAEIDGLIEPVCAKLLADDVAKVGGDAIDDAIFLPLADIVADAAKVMFGIASSPLGAQLAANAETAKNDLRLAYRVHDPLPPMRIENFWGGRRGTRALQSIAAPMPAPTDPITIILDGGEI